MPLHTILFDFDGTLADSASCAIIATQQAFRDHQLPVPPAAAIVQQMGIPIERCFRTLGATALDDATFATLLATFRQHYAAAANTHIRLYPGIAGLLAALRAQGRQTGIISSKKGAILRANCDALGISVQIDVFIGSNDVAHYKPHPAPSPGLIAPPPAPFTSAMPPPTSRPDAPRASKPAPSPGAHMTQPPSPLPARMRWCMMSPPCNTCCCRQWHGSRVGGIKNRLPAAHAQQTLFRHRPNGLLRAVIRVPR